MAQSRNENEKEKLRKALSSGDLTTFTILIESNPFWLVTRLGREKETFPLYIACQYGHGDLVKFILQKQPSLDDLFREAPSPLDWALQFASYDCAILLIEAGALKCKPENKITQFLFEMINQGRLKLVKSILTFKPSLLDTIRRGELPLIYAARLGRNEILHYFIVDQQVDLHRIFVNADSDGKVALALATNNGHQACVELLLKGGVASETDLAPSLYLAISQHCLNLVKLLLNANPALLNKFIDHGQTPVMHAAKEGHLEILRYLVELGADIFQRSDEKHQGKTALDWATYYDHEPCVKYLVDTSISKEGLIDYNPPLTIAIGKGHFELVKYYLEKKPSLNNDSLELMSFLYEAIKLRLWDIAALFFLRSHRSLDLIQDAELALCIIKQDASQCFPLLQNIRIQALIHASNHPSIQKNENKLSFYTTKRGRSSSTYTVINTTTFNVSILQPKEKLGEGNYGIVRLFSDNKQEKRAVKSLVNDVQHDDYRAIDEEKTRTEKEKTCLKIIDPIDNDYDSFHFSDIKEEGQFFYTNRLVMPFFGKIKLPSAISIMFFPYEYAEITLELALELQNIHHRGVIHGDVKWTNILTNPIRYCDCGLSRLITDKTTPTFKFQKDAIHQPPERFYQDKPTLLIPHPSQDVFSFGYMISTIFPPIKYKALINACPSVEEFVKKAASIDPALRPELKTFCEALSNELATFRETGVFQLGRK